MTVAVVLLTSDLRPHDHPPPPAALEAADGVEAFVRQVCRRVFHHQGRTHRRTRLPAASGLTTTPYVDRRGTPATGTGGARHALALR